LRGWNDRSNLPKNEFASPAARNDAPINRPCKRRNDQSTKKSSLRGRNDRSNLPKNEIASPAARNDDVEKLQDRLEKAEELLTPYKLTP